MFRRTKNFNDILKSFDEMLEQFNSDLGKWNTQTRMSEDGTMRITTHNWTANPKENKSKGRIEDLQEQLNLAIENEDFESAVKLRDLIKNYESNKKTIEKLESELSQSIKDQNFEKSIEIRDELKKLKK